MVKNCGDNVHVQIAERNILPEMIKIVKKKVKKKILLQPPYKDMTFCSRGGVVILTTDVVIL